VGVGKDSRRDFFNEKELKGRTLRMHLFKVDRRDKREKLII
jgi:hypothetical protein